MKEIFTLAQEIDVIYYILPKILVATICGAIIGWERETKNKVAGLRTNVLISVGSCIFAIISILCFKYYGGDPSRIISTIVTGIGFLGGGVIIKHEDRVVGVTSAAFIWSISAIGIFCAFGYVLSPILLTIGLLLITKYLESVERYIKNKNPENK